MTKIKNIAVALSAIVLFAGNTFATTTTVNAPVNGIYYGDEPAAELLSVNYLGEDADYLFFEVSVKTGNNKAVSFEVTDSNEGEELYSTTFSTGKTQTLKIEKRFNQELNFNVKAGTKSFTKSFTVMPTITLEVVKK